jgi:hypothetical protein
MSAQSHECHMHLHMETALMVEGREVDEREHSLPQEPPTRVRLSLSLGWGDIPLPLL